MQNFVWMDEQESEGRGRRRRRDEASGPLMQTHYCRAQLQAELMDPFLAHSSLSPSVILTPEGPQKNRWSGRVNRGCGSIIKVEQWLPRALSSGSLACTWFMLTLLAGSKLRLRFQPGSLPPACNPNLYIPTACRPKAVPNPPLLIPLEKESQHTWGARVDALHIPHGFGLPLPGS